MIRRIASMTAGQSYFCCFAGKCLNIVLFSLMIEIVLPLSAFSQQKVSVEQFKMIAITKNNYQTYQKLDKAIDGEFGDVLLDVKTGDCVYRLWQRNPESVARPNAVDLGADLKAHRLWRAVGKRGDMFWLGLVQDEHIPAQDSMGSKTIVSITKWKGTTTVNSNSEAWEAMAPLHLMLNTIGAEHFASKDVLAALDKNKDAARIVGADRIAKLWPESRWGQVGEFNIFAFNEEKDFSSGPEWRYVIGISPKLPTVSKCNCSRNPELIGAVSLVPSRFDVVDIGAVVLRSDSLDYSMLESDNVEVQVK
ncbi:MAG TPA: hypothetical protein VFE24_18465 [Pirellulales bacterium]|nr:hypothetical protein [Pirellulales bacterium]